MGNEQIAEKLIELVGGNSNILSVENCMTRVRIDLKDESDLAFDEIKKLDGVCGLVPGDKNLQIVFGPGKAQKMSTAINLSLKNAAPTESESKSEEHTVAIGNWENNKKLHKSKQKDSSIKRFMKLIGEIFVPMIPALIASGIFNGFSSLITTCIQQGSLPSNLFWNTVQLLFSLIGGSFITYLAIYTGINSAKQFGATQVLGGMVGAMSLMTQITNISQVIQAAVEPLNLPFKIYDSAVPLNSILGIGKGGIIGVIFGVWVLSCVEKWLHKKLPDTIELVLTPLISMFVISATFILFVMPVAGIFSDYLVKFLNLLLDSTVPVVQILSGFILSALFLPMVMLGIHQGLIPIYTVQLQSMGYITLFAVLAMAGAGQVGASIALYSKAKKVGNNNLKKVITGALPAGFLGVAEPLIYGVTVPLGKPFITAGIGAGFGGAWCMLRHVDSIAFGPSGLVAIPLMLPNSMLNFVIGLLISYVMGYIMTQVFIRKELVAKATF